jgi:chloride channel 3/4/5
MVHLACCVGNLISNLNSKYCNNEANKRDIATACTAVGVACAFGTPIGGVLFAFEELSYFFTMKILYTAYFMATVASIFMQLPISVIRDFNKYVGKENNEFLIVSNSIKWHLIDIPLFAFLGVLGVLTS